MFKIIRPKGRNPERCAETREIWRVCRKDSERLKRIRESREGDSKGRKMKRQPKPQPEIPPAL